MIKVHNEVQVIELDNKELTGVDRPVLSVDSHWNVDALVILKFGNKPDITVVATDLIRAVQNAMRTKL